MSTIIERNHVNVIGSGERVIMLAHGFGCDQTTWRFITDAFLKDYKLILFDYVGCGLSDISEYDYHKYATLDGYACDVLDIIEALKLKEVIFIGHSVSGMIGMLAALQKPELFEKLIFIGASPKYINANQYFGGLERDQVEELFNSMANDYLGWAKYMIPEVMQNADHPEFGEVLLESFEAMNPKMALAFAKATFNCDYRDRLKELTVPSVSLQAKEDFISSESVGNYIKRHTPHNAMHMMNATGHYPHISAPEETIKAIKSYIETDSKLKGKIRDSRLQPV